MAKPDGSELVPTLQAWVQVHTCDNFRPDLHWAEMFPCPPLGHCGVLDPIFMCHELQGHFFHQV